MHVLQTLTARADVDLQSVCSTEVAREASPIPSKAPKFENKFFHPESCQHGAKGEISGARRCQHTAKGEISGARSCRTSLDKKLDL